MVCTLRPQIKPLGLGQPAADDEWEEMLASGALDDGPPPSADHFDEGEISAEDGSETLRGTGRRGCE